MTPRSVWLLVGPDGDAQEELFATRAEAIDHAKVSCAWHLGYRPVRYVPAVKAKKKARKG